MLRKDGWGRGSYSAEDSHLASALKEAAKRNSVKVLLSAVVLLNTVPYTVHWENNSNFNNNVLQNATETQRCLSD